MAHLEVLVKKPQFSDDDEKQGYRDIRKKLSIMDAKSRGAYVKSSLSILADLRLEQPDNKYINGIVIAIDEEFQNLVGNGLYV